MPNNKSVYPVSSLITASNLLYGVPGGSSSSPSLLSNSFKLSGEISSSLYKLSVALLVGSGLKHAALYNATLGVMSSKIKTMSSKTPSKINGFAVWMIGRIVKASHQMSAEPQVVESWAMRMVEALTHLEKSGQRDCFYAWSCGYLAIYFANTGDEKNYTLWRGKTSDASTYIKDACDLMWVHVMNSEAAAAKGDQADFCKIIEMIKGAKKTILTAFEEKVPDGDGGIKAVMPNNGNGYQAWALSSLALSAAQLGLEAVYEELMSSAKTGQVSVVENAIKTSTDAHNTLLAKLTHLQAKATYEEKFDLSLASTSTSTSTSASCSKL